MNYRFFWKGEEVWAFDEDQEHLITDEFTELTAEELEDHIERNTPKNDVELT